MRVNPWDPVVGAPAGERSEKPRRQGLTMVIDKGLGLYQTDDLLNLCAPYIDFIKLGFGTSVLYPKDVLRRKVEAIRAQGIDVYPGGTLLEIAGLLGRAEAFFQRARELGFTAVEISEGTTELSASQRRTLIAGARALGLRVVTEVGKKEKGVRLSAAQVVQQVDQDLEWGSELVIIEGRDSGRGVGVYDDDGTPQHALIEAILESLSCPERVMWEAPLVAQQQYWLNRLGADANLGNVQVEDVITLEATRRALRGDTLRRHVAQLAALRQEEEIEKV